MEAQQHNLNKLNPLYIPPVCCICLEPIWSHATWCPHCKQCIHTACLEKWKKPTCPLCRQCRSEKPRMLRRLAFINGFRLW